MVRVFYTQHLKCRMWARGIPENFPEIIFFSSNERYYDLIEKNEIAVMELFYNGKIRPMLIAYEEKANRAEIITIHPITREKTEKRVLQGRWVKR